MFIIVHRILVKHTVENTQIECPVAPGDRADDVNLFEQRHPMRGLELSCGYCGMLGACDADLRRAGHQHHHHRLYVWDGDTRVLAETSAPHRHETEENLTFESNFKVSVLTMLDSR